MIMDVPKRTPLTQEIDGERCCTYFNPKLYRAVPQFEPQAGDIIQVSFPRAGTHWVQQIIQLILRKGESAKTYSEFIARAPFLEFQGSDNAADPRIFCTHSPMGRLRLNPRAKYVYVARNPWDSSVSCFHITRETQGTNYKEATFDDFLDAFLDGQFGFGDYFDHVLSGFRLRDEPNVFFVTYEELHRDEAGVVKRLAYFLGQDYGKHLENDRECFQKVMEKSTVEYMKCFINIPEGEFLELVRGNLDSATREKSEGEQTVVNFIRNGGVGGCEKYFSRENIRKMKAKIDDKFKGSEVMNLWKSEELLATAFVVA